MKLRRGCDFLDVEGASIHLAHDIRHPPAPEMEKEDIVNIFLNSPEY
jgi:hypothetical protein